MTYKLLHRNSFLFTYFFFPCPYFPIFVFFILLVFFSFPRISSEGKRNRRCSGSPHVSSRGDPPPPERTQLVSETILTISVAWMTLCLSSPFALKIMGLILLFSLYGRTDGKWSRRLERLLAVKGIQIANMQFRTRRQQ